MRPFFLQGAVLQEARIFNDNHVDPRRCQQVITKLLYLLTQGETLTKARAEAGPLTGEAARAGQGGGEALLL